MKRIFTASFILVLFISFIKCSAQSDNKTWTADQTKKWFNEKAWLGGLLLKPDKTINQEEFARQYWQNKIFWDNAFKFLKDQDLQKLAPGKYPIDGVNVFAIVTENPTRDYDSTRWESHREYIDLHYVISGEEKIGMAPINKLTVTNAYDASNDIIHYAGTGEMYTALPGTFFLFFPSDAHRPNITTGGHKTDRKLVIKIRYAHEAGETGQ